MDVGRTLDFLRSRPGLLGLDGSFGQHAAFVDGINAGQDGGFLLGFREWLIVRADVGANLTWRGLVLRLSLPNGAESGNLSNLSADEDKQIAAAFVELLSEFIDAREKPDGYVRIYDSYLKWLRGQEWYSPSSPAFLDGEK